MSCDISWNQKFSLKVCHFLSFLQIWLLHCLYLFILQKVMYQCTDVRCKLASNRTHWPFTIYECAEPVTVQSWLRTHQEVQFCYLSPVCLFPFISTRSWSTKHKSPGYTQIWQSFIQLTPLCLFATPTSKILFVFSLYTKIHTGIWYL